jgi:hypothetical protein
MSSCEGEGGVQVKKGRRKERTEQDRTITSPRRQIFHLVSETKKVVQTASHVPQQKVCGNSAWYNGPSFY